MPAGAIEPALCAEFVRNLAEHPFIRHHAAGDGCARRLSDIASRRVFRRLALYREFFHRVGIEHELAIGFGGAPTHLRGVGLERARRDFSEEELLLAELLRPRLWAAEAIVRRACARAALTAREREVLDLVATGAGNAAVAEALVISPATVKKPRQHLRQAGRRLANRRGSSGRGRGGRRHASVIRSWVTRVAEPQG